MNKYGKLEQAQTRLIKLMKDGVTGCTIVSKGGWHWVEGAPTKPVEPVVFGRFMENEATQEAALDLDPKAINVYDVGETMAKSATAIHGRSTKVWQRVVDADDIRLAQAGARVMSPSELRKSEVNS